VSKKLPLHCLFYVTVNIYFCFLCQYCTWRRHGLFVCLFVCCYKPENPYFAFRLGLEVKPLGVYPLWPSSSACGPTKGTPPPTTTLCANRGQYSKRWRVGSHPWTYASPIQTNPQPPNSVPRSPTSDPPKHWVLLILAVYLSLYLHIFTYAYRITHTHAHMYDQHTRGIATTSTGARLRGAEERLLLETKALNTKKNKENFFPEKNRYSRIFNKVIRAHLVLAKLLHYFLRSNKRNINQSIGYFFFRGRSWFEMCSFALFCWHEPPICHAVPREVTVTVPWHMNGVHSATETYRAEIRKRTRQKTVPLRGNEFLPPKVFVKNLVSVD